MLDLIILRLLLHSDLYDRYYQVIDKKYYSVNSKYVSPLLQIVERMRGDSHSTSDISVDDLELVFHTQAQLRPDDVPLYADIFSKLRDMDVSKDLAVEFFSQHVDKARAAKVAELALDVTEGKKSYSELADYIETTKDNGKIEVSYVSDDLQALVNNTIAGPGLNFRLEFLRQSIGPLRGGDFGFVFARPECFTPDTEVLTPNGWRKVDTITYDDTIASVSNGMTVIFEKPRLITERDDHTEVYTFHNKKGQVDIAVSGGHRMVYTQGGKWKESLAKDTKFYQGMKLHTAAFATGTRQWSAVDAVHVAYQADGRSRVYETHGYAKHAYGYEINLKKERKIERLEQMLLAADIEYTKFSEKNGYTSFYLKTDYVFTKDFSTISLDNMSADYARAFAKELEYWDGSPRSATRWKYSNTNKEAVDKAQAICSLSGWNTFLSEVKDKRGYATCYELHIRSAYVPVDGQSIIKEVKPYTGKMYCFSVSTGMLLLRRNGKVFVCGNTGKTTFLASEGTYLAEQLIEKNKDFIWFNNEEKGDKVKIRCYQGAFGITKDELLSDIPRWNQEWRRKYRGHFKMIDDAVISRFTIERILKQNNPGCVVIDQIDKITGFQADREDIYLGRIYQWARELAKRYDCPIIGICQAGGSGEGKLYMGMDDVASSKTSKQAEADFIIAIGKDHDRPELVRGIHIIKNKCSGDANTIEEYRHGKMAVIIDPPVARYVMQ
jgi:hypothetical protein